LVQQPVGASLASVQTNDMAKSPDQARLLGVGYRTTFIAVMFLVCLFNFGDRSVFMVLGQTLKREFQLSDLQWGLLSGPAFGALYAIAGIPLGRLAEYTSRVRITAVCTAIWSLMTLACGLATGFFTLMLARFGVGIGEAGFTAPTNSLVGDKFPKQRRASTISLIMLGTPAGLLTGSLVGGWAAAEWGWQAAFFAMGIPGLIVAFLVFALLREPDRGLVDGAPKPTSPPPNFGAFLKEMWRKKALLFVIIGGGMVGLASTSVSNFMPIFLQRVHEMDVRQAATFYGPISAGSLAIALIVGSFGADWLANRGDARWPAWVAAFGLALAPVVYFFALTTPSIAAATVLLVIAGAMMMMFYGPTSGMIQNMLEPRMRATGAAMFTMLNTFFGSVLAPPLVGFGSDLLAAQAFQGDFAQQCPKGLAPEGAAPDIVQACASASAAGVQQALMIAVCATFVACISFLMATRTIRQSLYEAKPAPHTPA
jgi:MFS family permease